MKFKRGNRVRFKRDRANVGRVVIGNISVVSGSIYGIDFEDGVKYCVQENLLELAWVRNTTLARAYHKGHKVVDKDWIEVL